MRRLFRFPRLSYCARYLTLYLCCILLLSACTNSPLRTLQEILSAGKEKQVERIPLDPRYRYLRVTINGKRSTVLILGYVDRDAAGDIETWYSMDGGATTLRLQNGRFIGGSGWPVTVPAWTHVRFSAQPDWNINAATTFMRQRDVMPAYDYGRTDTLTVQPIDTPKKTHLHGEAAPDWRWFEETSSGHDALPASHYAVETNAGIATVVYGEQCLTQDFCLSWERWPSHPQATQAPRP